MQKAGATTKKHLVQNINNTNMKKNLAYKNKNGTKLHPLQREEGNMK